MSTWRESHNPSGPLSVDLRLVGVLEDAERPRRALAGPSEDKRLPEVHMVSLVSLFALKVIPTITCPRE